VTRRVRRALAVAAAIVACSTVTATSTSADVASSRGKKTPPTTLLVLGDSLTWGSNFFAKAQSRLAATGQFESVVVDGWWSRRIGGIISTTYSGTNTYKKLTSNGVRPTAVIVALGTNDVFFLSDTIGNVPVVWVNVHRVESPTTVNRSRLFNDTLTRVIAEYPLASTFDWASVAKQNSAIMAWDKIHHTPTGYEVRTKAYLEIAALLAQRATDMTTTTTVAPTTVVPTTVAPTTVP